MSMNFWEIALLVAAAYFAVVTLVRMMRMRRDQLIDELTLEAEAEQERVRAEARQEKRRQMQKQIKQEKSAARRAA